MVLAEPLEVMEGGAAGWATGIGVGMDMFEGPMAQTWPCGAYSRGRNNYTTETRL